MKDEDVKMSSKIEKLIKKSIKQQKKLTKNIQDMKTNVPNVIKAANEKPDKDYSNLEEFIAYSIKCMQNELIEIAKFNGKRKKCR